jgi:hypothetical protein
VCIGEGCSCGGGGGWGGGVGRSALVHLGGRGRCVYIVIVEGGGVCVCILYRAENKDLTLPGQWLAMFQLLVGHGWGGGFNYYNSVIM